MREAPPAEYAQAVLGWAVLWRALTLDPKRRQITTRQLQEAF